MAAGMAHFNAQMHECPGDDSRPSIFDILSQESLMSGLKPAVKFVFKFGSSFYPNVFQHLLRHFDEYYGGFELLLQNYYLKHYSASYAENFYGLKRVLRSTKKNLTLTRHRLQSLAFLVVIPFIKAKLDNLLEKLKDDQENVDRATSRQRWILKKFIRLYPRLCACLEFWTLLLQVGYLIGKTDVHSPWVYMAGVLLRTTDGEEFSTVAKAIDKKTTFSTLRTILFKWLSKSLGVALLFIQFLDWWENNEREKKISVTLPIPDPPHELFLTERSVSALKPGYCPICRHERKNDTVLAVSGYVFCYSCIFQYVKRKSCCPVTKLPASSHHLIRLFSTRPPVDRQKATTP